MLNEPAKNPRFQHARTEAANRAEATALLIRCDYRVYRPEADIEGEDLVVSTPAGELFGVQLKGRPVVDWRRYGDRGLLMLFPSRPYSASPRSLSRWIARSERPVASAVSAVNAGANLAAASHRAEAPTEP